MSKVTLGIAAVAALGLSSLFSVTVSGGKAPGRVPVTTTIADSQDGAALRVGSDTEGAYVTTYVRKQVALDSSIVRYQTGTDWMLTTYYGLNHTPSSRRVFFDLSEPAAPGNPAPPFLSGYAQAHLIAKCRLVDVDLYQMAPGNIVDCPGSFRFQDAQDGAWYRFSFQPDNFPQVNRLRVTCLSSDAGGCKVWTITPGSTVVTGSDPNPKSLNKLLLIDGGTEAILEDLGDYYLSFKITVAR